jgi:hypothetical protein
LDTGIDYQHTDIRAIKDRIVEEQDWVGDGNGIKDVYGHGTHTVAFLLKAAPNADIFVARIAKDKYMENEEHVVKVSERESWPEQILITHRVSTGRLNGELT